MTHLVQIDPLRPSLSHGSFLRTALHIMITNKINDQFVWLFVQLPTEIRVQTIRLWRPVLFVGFMHRLHSHLNASEGEGYSRSAIFLKRGSTTCRGDFLWATMTLNK